MKSICSSNKGQLRIASIGIQKSSKQSGWILAENLLRKKGLGDSPFGGGFFGIVSNYTNCEGVFQQLAQQGKALFRVSLKASRKSRLKYA